MKFEPEMVMVEICEHMGWDFHTYMDQPQWFVNHIQHKLIGQAKANEYLKKKHGR